MQRPIRVQATAHETTLVFVSYNSAHLLRERLRALDALPVVVVDNASRDGIAELFATAPDRVRFLANRVNSGYGRAANQGLEEVETKYALLLNPDVEIGPEEVAALEAEAQRLDTPWLFIAPDSGVPPELLGGSISGLETVRGASGAALFFDVSAFRELGGFDPNIFLFYEETDLCRRAVEAGLEMYHAPRIRVEHPIGTSAAPTLALDYLRKWHFHWSALYFTRKHRMWRRHLGLLFRNGIVAGLKLRLLSPGTRRHALTHARHHSARFFWRGESAFLASGEPVRTSFMAHLEAKAALETEREAELAAGAVREGVDPGRVVPSTRDESSDA